MTWQDTLIELFNAAFPVSRAMSVHKLSAAEAWDSPAPRVAREKLLSVLARPDSRDSLLQAGQELHEIHAALISKENLSAQELIKLGVLSAAAQLLSSQALGQLDEPQALFQYTVVKLLPWLRRLARLGFITAPAALSPDSTSVQQSSRAIHPTGDLVSRDLTADEVLLSELVSTTRMLTEIVHQRARGQAPAQSQELF